MKETTSLADYVLKHYSRHMTEHEKAVNRHLTVLFKDRDNGPPAPGTAADITGVEGPGRRRLSSDPAVVADAQAGWDAARDRIARRLVRDHPDEVYLNRCPECASLTRTPTARLCLSCGHTWFHVPRNERVPRAEHSED